jgi:hypothetical protein
MKKVLTLLLFSFFLLHAFAQEKRIDKKLIPEQVKTYLQRTYPSAREIHFFKKNDKDSLRYEVEFELNKHDYNLRFSPGWDLLETEREIELEEIPPSLQQRITSTLHENFKTFKIKKIQEVDPVGINQYEVYVKVKKGNQFKGGFYNVMFDGTGKLLSIEKDLLYSIESVF